MPFIPKRAVPTAQLALVLLFALLSLPLTLHAGDLPAPLIAENAVAQTLGTGNGRIHVIPSLNPPSLKDGEKLHISALVKSSLPVKSVVADLGGLGRVELKPNARLGLGTLPGGSNAAIYEGEWTGTGLEEKVYTATITVTDMIGFSHTDRSLRFSDPAAGNSTPGTTGYPNGGMTRLAAETMQTGESNLRSSVIDTTNGYAYFGTNTSPGRVVKVALGSGSNAPTRTAAVTLNSGENGLQSAVIDAANGYAYFGTSTLPGRVVKVALGSGANAPTRTAAVTLNSGENFLLSAVIDATNGYAYFGTNTYPGRVVKVALGSGSNAPTRTAALTLSSGEDGLQSAVIDTANAHAYFGTNTDPGKVVKVALGSGSSAPIRRGAVTLGTGEMRLHSAVIDAANAHAYFGTASNPGIVIKVSLGSGVNAPTRVGAVTLNNNEDKLERAVIDTANGHAYFGTFTSSGKIVKVALGTGSGAPTHAGVLSLGFGGNDPISAVIDPTTGQAYFGTDADPGNVVKVALSQRGNLKATRIDLAEPGIVEDVRLYSHAASGNVRLAIYDDMEPKNLIWESGSVANSAADADLVVPISAGTPSTLLLPTGTYWTAWQMDSTADVPSYTAGTSGDGFTFSQVYGAAPASLASAAITSTNQTWTQYITYTADNTAPTSTASAAATKVGGDIAGTYTADDATGSGVASVNLYVREPGGSWTDTGTVSGGTWSYTPTLTGDAADGAYAFATVATDALGNSGVAPTGSDPGNVTVNYNDAANSAYTVVYTAAGTAIFPMTATLNVEIAIAGATAPVTLTVSRTTGDSTPGAGLDPVRLIDEHLTIDGNLNGATATLTWNFDPTSDAGLPATLDRVFQLDGTTVLNEYPVTPDANPIVVGGITSFSSWWAGNNNAVLEEWTILD